MSTPENTPPLPSTPRVSLRGPVGLVQAVPYLLGHTGLSDDLVLIATRDNVTVLTVRVDLPVLLSGQLWDCTISALEAAGAFDVHLVAFPADPIDDGVLRFLHGLLQANITSRPEGLGIGHVVTTTPGRCWEHDPYGLPPTGEGIPIVEDPGVTLALNVTHGVPAPTRGHLMADLAPHSQSTLDQVEEHLQDLAPSSRAQRLGVASAALGRRRARPVDWTILEAATVLDALTDVQVRDEMIVLSSLDHCAWTWLGLLPYAPAPWRAQVAVLAAFAAHQRGDGVIARGCIDQALDADPGHKLARLFERALDLGVTPAYVQEDLLAPVAQKLATRR